MLKREIISTEDGSKTIHIPEWNESYHSKHGAIQEAYHVFIQNGLDVFSNQKELSILEFGFGTGLNALITFCENFQSKRVINYTGIEKFPVLTEELEVLDYASSLKSFQPEIQLTQAEIHSFYQKMMSVNWNDWNVIVENFNLNKIQADFLSFEYPENAFDLVYFDAFGARVQPELWTEVLFEKIYKSMKIGGWFTTYSAKGSVRRALIAVGFAVEKRPGPPGKREMLVARKL